MNIDLDKAIRHAVMANHDGELKAVAIVMIANGEPEVHMAVRTDVAHEMNSGVDMLKIEMLQLLNERMEKKKDRE